MPDLYALYKPWRNRVAELDLRESLYVVWAYSQANSVNDFAMPNDIAVERDLVGGPGTALNLWELEILAGEIILNAGKATGRQRSLRNPAELLNIVQGLRSLENVGRVMISMLAISPLTHARAEVAAIAKIARLRKQSHHVTVNPAGNRRCDGLMV